MISSAPGRSPNSAWGVVALLAVALAAGACGGSGSRPAATGSSPAATTTSPASPSAPVTSGSPATSPATTPATSPAGTSVPCATGWGTAPKASGAAAQGELINVRAGRHSCFDRLVIDISTGTAGYSVRYVGRLVREDTGKVVPLRGGAYLAVTALVPARATDALFLPNGDLINVAGYRTFRQVTWGGATASRSTVALGVVARLPFRVTVLPGPGEGSRILVDVALAAGGRS